MPSRLRPLRAAAARAARAQARQLEPQQAVPEVGGHAVGVHLVRELEDAREGAVAPLHAVEAVGPRVVDGPALAAHHQAVAVDVDLDVVRRSGPGGPSSTTKPSAVSYTSASGRPVAGVGTAGVGARGGGQRCPRTAGSSAPAG